MTMPQRLCDEIHFLDRMIDNGVEQSKKPQT